MGEFVSFGIYCIWIYHRVAFHEIDAPRFIIHLSVTGHLIYFQYLAIRNKATLPKSMFAYIILLSNTYV